MLVGVTGNFTSGKSAFMRIINKLGYRTFSSDRFVEKIYHRPEIIEKIGEEFGKTIVFNEKIDKELLSMIVFNNKKKLEKLNSIIHPLVKKKIMEIRDEMKIGYDARDKEKIVFVEVPLLFEAKMGALFDKIILVKCSEKTAIARAKSKGYTESEFGKIFASQQKDEQKVKKADFVVDSEGPMDNTRKQAEEIAEDLEDELD